jgi:hypothetical protein
MRLHPVICTSPHLGLGSIISLILRCMRSIEGPSMASVAFLDLLIFTLSLRLQAELKDPKCQQLTDPVTIRREKKVVLGLTLRSDSHPIGSWGWGGIQLQQTASVKPVRQPFSGRLLKLSIQVLACSTGFPNVQPCTKCWDRERQRIDPSTGVANLQPYMINFTAGSLVTVLSTSLDRNNRCLKADVRFCFTCYSNHHGGDYG